MTAKALRTILSEMAQAERRIEADWACVGRGMVRWCARPWWHVEPNGRNHPGRCPVAEQCPLPQAGPCLQQAIHAAAQASEDVMEQQLHARMILAAAGTIRGKSPTRAEQAMPHEGLNVAKAERQLGVAEVAAAVDVHGKKLGEAAIAQDARVP